MTGWKRSNLLGSPDLRELRSCKKSVEYFENNFNSGNLYVLKKGGGKHPHNDFLIFCLLVNGKFSMAIVWQWHDGCRSTEQSEINMVVVWYVGNDENDVVTIGML